MLGIQGEGLGPQAVQTRPKKSGAPKKPINLVTQQHQQHQKRQSSTNPGAPPQQMSIVGSGVKKAGK